MTQMLRTLWALPFVFLLVLNLFLTELSVTPIVQTLTLAFVKAKEVVWTKTLATTILKLLGMTVLVSNWTAMVNVED